MRRGPLLCRWPLVPARSVAIPLAGRRRTLQPRDLSVSTSRGMKPRHAGLRTPTPAHPLLAVAAGRRAGGRHPAPCRKLPRSSPRRPPRLAVHCYACKQRRRALHLPWQCRENSPAIWTVGCRDEHRFATAAYTPKTLVRAWYAVSCITWPRPENHDRVCCNNHAYCGADSDRSIVYAGGHAPYR